MEDVESVLNYKLIQFGLNFCVIVLVILLDKVVIVFFENVVS